MVRWRYPIAVVILIACVALNISGSSVAQWGRFLEEEGYQGTLLGLPRPIRSDEWDVMTPFDFSQAASGFNAASPVLVGGGTDVTPWSMASLRMQWQHSSVLSFGDICCWVQSVGLPSSGMHACCA